MKTSKQQLLAMLRHRLLPERSRRATRWHVLMLLLALLIGGSPQAWADYSGVEMTDDSYVWDKTITDGGGGNVHYTGEVSKFLGLGGSENKWWDRGYFKTKKAFDVTNDQFYWDFELATHYEFSGGVAHNSDLKYRGFYGDIYVVTADDQSHQIAHWEKNYDKITEVPYQITDNTWGYIYVSDIYDLANGIAYSSEHYWNIKIQYMPSSQAFVDGVKRIVMKERIAAVRPGYYNDLGWVQYEKNIDCTALKEDSPMPKLKIEWNEDGQLGFKAENAPDKRDKDIYLSQYYDFDWYYYKNGRQSKDKSFSTAQNNITCTKKADSKMDITFDYWPETPKMEKADYAYTVPVYLRYRGGQRINVGGDLARRGTSNLYLDQPFVNDILIKPFTRPVTVTTEFDQWNKKVVVKWTNQTSAKGFDGTNEKDVACREDGKWYVVRYEEGGSASDYTNVGELSSDNETLQITDDKNIDYEKQYVYRVIFLPDILESKYKNKLTKLPGYQRTHNETDLWEEDTVATTLKVPIMLTQDKSYEDGVRLKWEYSVPVTGLTWHIDHRPANTNYTWLTLNETISIDPEKTEAEFITTGTVCDLIEYRVRTTVGGREVYSNIASANLPTGSSISEVTASKGTEESTVIVKWKVKRPDTEHDIYYRVQRRPIGETEWTLLTDEIHGTASEYTYIDNRPLAGSYYEYSVQAYGAECDNQLVQTDEVIAAGFSQAKGTITGHVSYGTGTAVQGAKVKLFKASSDAQNSQPQFLSRYINDEGKGLQWTADSAKYAGALNGGKELTLQLWAQPFVSGADQQQLLQLKNAIELGVKKSNGVFHLYAIDNSNGGKTLTEFPSLTFSTTDFTHIAATYSKGKWRFYTGTDTLQCDSMLVAKSTWTACPAAGALTFSVGGSNRLAGKAFSGNADDIRLWTRALTRKEIESNYTRILGGTEDGMILYWPLDEGIKVQKYAFDVARQDGIYQQNHPEVGVNAVPSAAVPQHLELYGETDKKGNYIIRGIPFQQGGTNYEISPMLGVHRFSPAARSMFVSPTSLTANNIDFEDVSSFSMHGHVYYAGTNIPAEGIQLYVDGELLTTNGEVQQTDANGYYNISVPIGDHYVEAKLKNHVMVAGGRYPTTKTHPFNAPVSYDFADSTLVNFVGRVGGGVRNDTLAVGFGASKNNIGVATITLKLNNDSRSFNCLDKDHKTPAATDRIWTGDTVNINSRAWTGHEGSDIHYIKITTDSLTGEFAVKLPPLKYITKSISIDKNRSVEFTTLPQIDLTNVIMENSDSLKIATEQGDSVWNYYKYHTKMVKTYFATPQVDISQPKSEKGVFGIDKYEGEDELGKFTISDIWSKKSNDSISYRFGYPIYEMDKEYQTSVFGYEVYINKDTGKALADTIPMNGQVLTISNEMSSEQDIICVVDDPNSGYTPGQVHDLKRNQLALDSLGRYTFEWTAGAPNVTAPYTRRLGVTLERNKRTYSPASLDAIVVGSLPMGNNFVTKGYDQLLMVLRDPPGSKSKTVWKKGTVETKVRTTANGGYGTEKLYFETNVGVLINIGVGIGVWTQQTDIDNTTDVGFGAKYEWNRGSTHEETWTITATDEVSTSSNPVYAGSPGDVFIGYSKNLLLGTCRKVGFFRENESAPFELKDDVAVSFGDSVKTKFMYTAYELENVMIPKWEQSRNSYLTQHFDTKEEAEAWVNNGNEVVYATWLKKNNENYGQDGTYLQKVPKSWDEDKKQYAAEDEVAWCNDQIVTWKKALRLNEEDKVKSMEMRALYWKENISFDGGTQYVHSDRNDTTDVTTHTYTHKLGGVVKFGATLKNAGAGLQYKTQFGVDTENGWSRNEVWSDYDENEKRFAEFDYVFDDGNRDTDFSVDIYKSRAGWSNFFSLFGGQSYNPYEGPEYTKYYMKDDGTPYQLSNGTVQMEQPDIQISTDGVVAAKNAVLTDVPSGEFGQFTLHLTNNTTTNQGKDFTYLLSIAEGSNQHGLEILMDGVPVNGRGVFIPAGETVKKVITVRQTDQSVLDYENVELWFTSAYQPTKIYDIAKLSVYFKPSSSPIELAITEPVVNCNTDSTKLEMKLKGFNRQFKNLKNIGIQYRFAGNTQWTTLHTWVTNIADSTSTSFSSLPKSGDIYFAENMSSELSYPEGTYEFRAFTTTPYGNEEVQVFSEVTQVVKDTTKPRPLYTPSPANGILGIGDQLAIEFNEDIVPGYAGGDNVVVTAKLNSSEVHHDVAYQLVPFEEMMPRTVNPVFLTSSFAMDFWLNWHEAGTILHLGEKTDNFALSIGDDGYVTVTMGNNTYRSDAAVPKDKWTFFALNYDTEKKVFNMLALQDKDNIDLFSNRPVTMENVQAVHYLSDNRLYLGPVEADIHSLGLYNYCRDLSKANEEKYNAKDGYVYGLANFWPMDEGHGTVAGDLRHTHDFVVKDMWKLENKNYGLMINKPEGIMADITRIGTGDGESYAIEMWFNKSGNPKGETVFETATPDPYSPMTNLNKVTNLHLRFDSLQNLVLDYGGKSQVVASHEAFPDLRRYHHYALNVVRGQAASFYLDGQRTAVIPEADVPPMQGTSLVVGRNNEMLALVDEIRIWHAALSESRLLSNMYNTIDTADVYSRGLVAYYPFEKTGEENGVTTKVIALENMAPKAAAMVLPADTASLIALTPPLKNAPDETVLTATPVASERKVVINLSMVGLTARQLEGTTLNITVAEIHDLHGNMSDPIKWTAYVQQNTLKWTRDSVNVIKQYGEDHTFDVDIENKSGNTEYYTLYNMPQWLTVVGSSTSDDIAPLRTKTLRFRVNPLVPVGNYDVTIGLQGNNGILEPLRIVMKVRGETPQWAVDPTKYEHQMSIVGQVYINGILMENAESMVAAFIGDECRGVASPERVRGAAYVTMTVYGKDTPAADMGKAVTFRIWDATQGVAYTDAQITVDGSPTDVTFSQDKLIGTFDKPVIWTKSENVEQLIPIHLNWNWIAFGVEPKSTYLDHVFGAYAEWAMLIKNREGWNDYNGAEWGDGTLREAKANEMYKLKITRLSNKSQEAPNSLLAVSGRQLKEKAERAVTLSKGWNWIAYTPLTTMTVDEALAAANPKVGDIVKSQTGVAMYSIYGWEGSLKALEGGRGYLYFSSDSIAKSFLYPATSAASAKARMAAPRRAPEDGLCIFHPVDRGLYPSNMTMAVRLLGIDGSPVDTCEVAAFVDDECRGASRASSNGLYYLVISGDGAGQPMTLRTCIDGKIIDIDNSLMYVSDDNIGTSWDPYVIDLSSLLSGISAVNGSAVDDDSDWWTLQGFKIGRKPTQPGVYIHHGRKVTIKRVK